MTDDTTSEPTTTEETWVYMGQRVTVDNKVSHVWCDDDDHDQLHMFGKLKGHGIGGRYVVTIQGDSVFTTGERAPRYVDLIDDDEQRQAWALAERVALIARERGQRAKREAGTNPLSEQLAPLREQYRKTVGHVRRAALIAAIIEQVTS